MAGKGYAWGWADQILDGHLTEILEHTTELTLQATRDVLKDSGVEVSIETIRRWRHRLEEAAWRT